jgi:CRP-like cAMP-binding protein
MDYLIKEKTTQLVYDYFKQYQVTREQCAEMAIHLRELKLKRGSYFIEIGQIAPHFGLITEGVMQNCIIQADGTKRVQYFLKEGAVVSNAASFDLQVPSKLSIQAITDCRLLTMDYDTFQKMNETTSWLHRLISPISSIVLQNYLKEYADLLRMSQQERYKEFLIRNPDIIHRIPLVMIASYLGMSSQSLSRIRAIVQKNAENGENL